MSGAQKILDMIESVDPVDTETLDEIDARVWCWYNLKRYTGVQNTNNKNYPIYKHSYYSEKYDINAIIPMDYCRYTRSRDVLKNIRPDGWTIKIYCYYADAQPSFHCAMENYGHSNSKNKLSICSNELPTEELAELHAIIQAIQYEREQQ